jgi:hypothetical protein
MMYQIVSPILYEAPVVQDMGLFLQGIEKPLPNHDRLIRRDGDKMNNDDDHAVPYHKKKLLGQIKRLYIVHASSSKSTGPAYMLTRDTDEWRTPVEACTADVLGTRDLSSWIMAKDLIRQLKNLRSEHRGYYRLREAFSQLNSVSFGTWDTGRWNRYQLESFGQSRDDVTGDSDLAPGQTIDDVEPLQLDIIRKRKACPQLDINGVLHDILAGTRALVACHDALALIVPDHMIGKEEGLLIIHNAPIEHTHLRRTRIYTTTSALQASLSDAMEGHGRDLFIGFLYLSYNSQMKPVFRLPDTPLGGLSRLELEICLMPENEGDERQLQLARDVRDALERFAEISKKKNGPQKDLAKARDVRPISKRIQFGFIKKDRPKQNLGKARDVEEALEIFERGFKRKDGPNENLGNAREIRDTSERVAEGSKNQDEPNRYLGKIKIIVGDDIPACPCCGARK